MVNFRNPLMNTLKMNFTSHSKVLEASTSLIPWDGNHYYIVVYFPRKSRDNVFQPRMFFTSGKVFMRVLSSFQLLKKEESQISIPKSALEISTKATWCSPFFCDLCILTFDDVLTLLVVLLKEKHDKSKKGSDSSLSMMPSLFS